MLMFRKAITIILMQAISEFLKKASSIHKVYKMCLWSLWLVPSLLLQVVKS